MPKLPSSWWLIKTTTYTLWSNKRLFVSITLIYGLLSLVLVHGFASSTDVSSLKNQLETTFGTSSAIAPSLGVYAVLVGTAGGSGSQAAGVYQFFLGLIVSLAIIWALRQVMSNKRPRARDAYYQGMYPLVPFILVLVVIGLQLIPLVVGSALYSAVVANNIAVNVFQKIVAGVLFGGLALFSMYMVSASVFALYIVALPNMTPRKALRSARELVKRRRLVVLRKVLVLPLMLLIVSAIIMLPTIAVVPAIAQWVFFVLTMFTLVAVHGYFYTFYRELLNE